MTILIGHIVLQDYELAIYLRHPKSFFSRMCRDFPVDSGDGFVHTVIGVCVIGYS